MMMAILINVDVNIEFGNIATLQSIKSMMVDIFMGQATAVVLSSYDSSVCTSTLSFTLSWEVLVPDTCCRK